MKQHGWACMFVIVSCLAGAALPASGQAPPGGGGPVGGMALKLQVVGPDANGVLRPIRSLEVCTYVGKKGTAKRMTDATGSVTVDTLPVGAGVALAVWPNDYESTSIGITVDAAAQTFKIVPRYRTQGTTVTIGDDVCYRWTLTRKSGAPAGQKPAAKGKVVVRVVAPGAGGRVPVDRVLVEFVQGAGVAASGISAWGGRYSADLPVGQTYTVVAKKPGFRNGQITVTVVPGTIDRDVQITPLGAAPPPPPPPPPQGQAVLRVRVSRALTYAAIPDAVVVVARGGAEVKRARTGPDGMCSLRIPPGKYKLTAMAGGFQKGETKVSVTPGGATAQVTLRRN